MRPLLAIVAMIALLSGAPGPTRAADDIPVDVELVLAVDLSLSMMPEELEIQRSGYAAALNDPAVVRAMLSGLRGRVAITFVEWAGFGDQAVVVPWQEISSIADAQRFAEQISARRRGGWRRTSLSGALAFSASLFDNNGFTSPRHIIDISGDGPNNDGPAVTLARDAAINRGITVNGLPLMTRIGLMSVFEIDDLDQYYSECVIGGPGSFVIPVFRWNQFLSAVRRKLVLELSGKMPDRDQKPRPTRLLNARLVSNHYDCLIGEKLWEKQFGR